MDLQGEVRLTRVEEKQSTTASSLERHLDSCEISYDKLSRRVLRLEIMAWVAIGGIMVLGWLINKASSKILLLLGGG